jgi:hypothetical protein
LVSLLGLAFRLLSHLPAFDGHLAWSDDRSLKRIPPRFCAARANRRVG